MLNQSQAKQLGKEMRQQMRDPKQWEIYVHKNIGHFVRLNHKASGGLLSVSPTYEGFPVYRASLSLAMPFACDIRWHDVKQFKNPQSAVDYMMQRARHRLLSELQVFKAIAGEMGGALPVRKKGK